MSDAEASHGALAPKCWTIWLSAAVAVTGFFGGGVALRVLRVGYPHEDAYILFIYFEFLDGNASDYTVFAAHYRGAYNHLYALRNDIGIEPEAFAEAPTLSYAPEGRISYMGSLSANAEARPL